MRTCCYSKLLSIYFAEDKCITSNPCKNKGVCQSNGASCKCVSGYTGQFCQTKTSTGESASCSSDLPYLLPPSHDVYAPHASDVMGIIVLALSLSLRVCVCVCVSISLSRPNERTSRLEFWHGGQVEGYLVRFYRSRS